MARNSLQKEIVDLNSKLAAVEQKYAQRSAPICDGNTNDGRSIGQKFIESAGFKSMIGGGLNQSGKVDVGSMWGTKALTSVDANGNVIGPRYREGNVVRLPQQRPVVRDFINVIPISESSVEYVKESSFSNNAAIQWNSPSYDGTAKAESDIAFALATAPVRTIAHYIKASKQVLADTPQLRAIIDSQLMNGLRLKEEYQILRGAGTAGNLNGIIGQASAYDTGMTVSGDTRCDLLLHAIAQVGYANYTPDAIFVHPQTVHALMALKATAGTEQYIFGNPASTTGVPTIWGLPLIGTLTMASDKFLVGAFSTGCNLYDREQASVAVSMEDGTNFVSNMCTVLCEERVALAVTTPAGFVYGTF